mmetsp:Transcript_38262/g.95820  ORF Transcript_38262/g.95820 Transcript_38262/m.95820 type:complete len:164 (-) Transcript_38262:1203-1694(-)
MVNATVGRSSDVIQRYLTAAFPGTPAMAYPIADVRDVALAHVACLEGGPQVVGKRFPLGEEAIQLIDIATTLKGEFGKYGYRVPTTRLPTFLAWLLSFCDKGVAQVLPELGRRFSMDSSGAREILNIQPRDFKQAAIDQGYSLIKLGIVPNKGVPEEKLQLSL